MVTQDNIMEHLKNNPEEKKVLDEQLEYFFPKWISSKYKLNFVNELPQKDTDFMFQALLLLSISENDINTVNNEHSYIKIRDILLMIQDGNDDLVEQISKIYFDNVKTVIGQYELKIEEYKYKKLPKKKKEQVDKLRINKKWDIAEQVITEYYKANQDIISKLLEHLDNFKNLVNVFDPNQFTSNVLKLNPAIFEKLVYAIYNPAFLMPVLMDNILNENISLPCEWYLYRKLTVTDYKEFMQNVSNSATWNEYFNMAINSIYKQIEIPILPIKKRRFLIEEILVNLKEKRYESGLIVLFSVIEGLLWEFTMIVNKEKQIYSANNQIFDCDNNSYFEGSRIRDVLERTYVKDYLDDGFLRYFCKELYEERNPVLHGRQICKECPNIASCIVSKVFTLDYILMILTDNYQRQLFDSLDKSFSKEKIEEFINLYKGFNLNKCVENFAE